MTAPVQRETVRVGTGDGILMAYSVRPSDERAVATALFFHGKTFPSVPDFDLQVPGATATYSFMEYLAARGVHCWCFDHRGFGGSWKPPEGSLFTARVRANDAREVLHALKDRMPKPLVMVGLSLGCSAVADLFRTDPKVADAVVLLGPARWQSFHTVRGYFTSMKLALMSGAHKSAYVKVPAKAIEQRLFAGEEQYMKREVLDAFVQGAIRANPEGPPDAIVAYVSELMPFVSRPRINVPVLVLRGSADTISTSEDIDAVRRFIAPELLTVKIFPNRKHDLHLYERRDDVFAALHEFVAAAGTRRAR